MFNSLKPVKSLEGTESESLILHFLSVHSVVVKCKHTADCSIFKPAG